MPLTSASSLMAQMIKNLSAVQETWLQSLGWEDFLGKGMVTHSTFLPEDFHGQRSLVSCSSWGYKYNLMLDTWLSI